eukprot:847996-Pyramimonas_sp.AAC.1
MKARRRGAGWRVGGSPPRAGRGSGRGRHVCEYPLLLWSPPPSPLAADPDHRRAKRRHTGEAHTQKHPARLQGALSFDGFAVEGVAFPRQKSTRTSLGLRVGFLVE